MARTKTRDHSRYHAARAEVEQAIPPAKRAYTDAVRALQESARSGDVYYQIAEQASPAQIVGALDWDGYQAKMADFADHLAAEQVGAARRAYEQVVPVAKRDVAPLPSAGGVGLSFDLRQHAAEVYAAQHAADRVTAISDSTRQAISDLVQRALAEGWSPDRLTAAIKNTVGLAPRYTNALATYEQGLLDKGTFSDGQIRLQVARLRDQYLQLRANTIARTEVATAQSAGRQAGWNDALDAGVLPPTAQKEWLTGPDPCPECEDMEGEIVAVDESFSTGDDGPPLHVQCVCSTSLVLDSF